jgi:hypothetical protein
MALKIMTVEDFIDERPNVKEVRRLKLTTICWTPACVLRCYNTAAVKLVRDNKEWFDSLASRYFNPQFCNGIYFESMADAIACKLAFE